MKPREYIIHTPDGRGFDVRWLSDVQVDYLRRHGYTVDPVINSIPEWVARLRLARVWCWLQDKGVVRE